MTPGTADLALAAPRFPRAAVALPSGAVLAIRAAGAVPGAPYVQSAAWDGRPWDAAYAPPPALLSGGTLSFALGASASSGWAAGPAAAPPSYGAGSAP
jgi:putative alpha-1,2-mannosidase